MRHLAPTTRLSPSTDRAVERLTQAHAVVHDGHVSQWPPLLDWLENAITDQVKRGGAGSGGTGSPINLGALQLFDHIRAKVAQIREAVYIARRTADGDLKADLADAWRQVHEYRAADELDDIQWERITEAIERWVTEIEAEWEERTHRMELTVACPRCEKRWVYFYTDQPDVVIDEGKLSAIADGIRRAAIVVEYAEGRAPIAECRAVECDGHWVGWEQITQLGRAIDTTVDLAVLEACGISLS